MGDESKPAQPGDEKGATTPDVAMANDEGADPTSDVAAGPVARGNVHSEQQEEPELQAPEAQPS